MGEVVPHEEFVRAKEEKTENSAPKHPGEFFGNVVSSEQFEEVRRVKEYDKEMIKELGLPPNATKDTIAAAVRRRSEDVYHQQLKERSE